MVLDNIRTCYKDMTDAEKRVADYILSSPSSVVRMSMNRLSEASETSDATVMRMCKLVGETGFHQLKISLAMELSAEPEAPRASEGPDEEPNDIVEFLRRTDKGILSISKTLDSDAVHQAIGMLRDARTVFVFGWGNSSVVAADLAHRLARCGVNTFTTESTEYVLRSLVIADPRDILIVFTHTGQSTVSLETMRVAREQGIKVVLITNDPTSEAGSLADCILCTGDQDELLGDFGITSHLHELVINDLILYFLTDRGTSINSGHRSEEVISHWKL